MSREAPEKLRGLKFGKIREGFLGMGYQLGPKERAEIQRKRRGSEGFG